MCILNLFVCDDFCMNKERKFVPAVQMKTCLTQELVLSFWILPLCFHAHLLTIHSLMMHQKHKQPFHPLLQQLQNAPPAKMPFFVVDGIGCKARYSFENSSTSKSCKRCQETIRNLAIVWTQTDSNTYAATMSPTVMPSSLMNLSTLIIKQNPPNKFVYYSKGCHANLRDIPMMQPKFQRIKVVNTHARDQPIYLYLIALKIDSLR